MLDQTRVIRYSSPLMSENIKVPMTPKGHADLKALLYKLKTKDRQAAVAALEEARSHGDLSENAEYDIAKERLSQLDRHISEIGMALVNAQVIDPMQIKHSHVVFGATVRLVDQDSDETLNYQIVGIYEVDIENNRISIESPIARALIGREEGDEVKVKTPKGLRKFEIVEVLYE